MRACRRSIRSPMLVLLLLGIGIGLEGHGACDVAAAGVENDSAEQSASETYIMLIRLRGDLHTRWKETGVWPDDREADQALSEHGRYWAEHRGSGRAILGGGMGGDYWDNVALIIFKASSMEEAEALVRDDPAVRAHVFQAQVRPFDLYFVRGPAGPE